MDVVYLTRAGYMKIMKDLEGAKSERLKIAKQLTAALRRPGFLKGDLVKAVEELARKLENGDEIK